jgi:hypothetical protein
MADGTTDNPENLSGGEDSKEESWSFLGLVAAAKFSRDQMATLRQWDHSGDPDRQIPGDPNLDQRSLNYLLNFFVKNRGNAQGVNLDINSEIEDIQRSLAGFAFREAQHLPGVQTQVQNIRQQLYNGSVEEAGRDLQILSQQGDTKDDVAQLKIEFGMIMDLHESGQIPDIKAVLGRVYKEINMGLDFCSISECRKRLEALRRYRDNFQALNTLAEVQNQGYVLEEADELIPRLESDITHRVVDELNFRRSLLSDSEQWRENSEIEENSPATGRKLIEKARDKLIAQTGATIDLSEFDGMEPEKIMAELNRRAITKHTEHERLTTQRDIATKSLINRASVSILHGPTNKVTELARQTDVVANEQAAMEKLIRVLPYVLEAEEFLGLIE